MGHLSHSTWDEVLFILAGLCLMPPLILLVRSVKSCAIISQASRFFNVLRNAARDWSGEVDEEVQILVNEKILEEKVETYRKMAAGLCVAAAPVLVFLMVQIGTGDQRYAGWALDVNCLLQQAGLGLVALRPSVLTPSNMDAYYSFVMLGNAFVLTPWTCPVEVLVPVAVLTNFWTMVFAGLRRSVGTRRAPATALVNVIFAVCAASTLLVHGKAACFKRPQFLAIAQLGIVAVSTWVSYLVELKIRALLHRSLQFKESQELHSAACALLRSCCEVVVELDPEGLIMTEAVDLSSFLLRGPHSLRGTRLVDLMVEDSREEFTRRLETPLLSQVGLAETAPCRMRDGDGSLLHLEMLWVQFTRLDGSRRFLLGVREKTEPPPQDPSLSCTTDCVLSDVTTAINSFTLPETNSVSSGPIDSRPAMAFVDCLEPGYPIRRLTDEFCVRIGRPALGTPMIQVVEKGKQFTRWMEKCIRAWEEDEDAPSDLKVHLRMPQGSMKARCRMVKAPYMPDGGEARVVVTDMESVCLLFYNIRLEGHRDEAAPRACPSMKGTPRSCNAGVETTTKETNKDAIVSL